MLRKNETDDLEVSLKHDTRRCATREKFAKFKEVEAQERHDRKTHGRFFHHYSKQKEDLHGKLHAEERAVHKHGEQRAMFEEEIQNFRMVRR